MRARSLGCILIIVIITSTTSCNHKLDGTYTSSSNPNHKLIFNDTKMTLKTQYGKMDYEYNVRGNKVYTKSGIYPITENGCIYAMNESYCKQN